MRISNLFPHKTSIERVIQKVGNSQGQHIEGWIDLIQLLAIEKKFPAATLQQIESHEINHKAYVVNYYADEIMASATSDFRRLSKELNRDNAARVADQAIAILVQKKSIFQCRDSHTEGLYYDHAEPEMEWQWRDLIAPYIKDADLSSVLELAPGHGRNSIKLIQQGAKKLHLVDVNQTCIDACRKRFGPQYDDCLVSYYVTEGDNLPFIDDESITFVYSFDSMVHFDKSIVRAYLREFARIMRRGATGYLHHSNLGALKPNSDWAKNDGNRSDMSAKLFREYCAEFSLQVTKQMLHGRAQGRGTEDLDCASLILKP